MLLHYAQNSRAVRVAWLLEELNLPYTIKKYKLGDKEMREESYKKLNPLGRVPTLEDGELTISESGAIIQYIISKYGNNQFIPEININSIPIESSLLLKFFKLFRYSSINVTGVLLFLILLKLKKSAVIPSSEVIALNKHIYS